MGFTAAKMDIDDALDPARLDRVNWTASNGEIDHMVAKVAFTRQLYPKHFDLAVVMHGRYDAGTGKRVNVKEATAGLTRAGVASSVVPFTELQSRDGVDIVTVKELLGDRKS